MLIGENEKDFVVVVFSCFYFVSLLFNDVYGFISCNCRQVYELAFEQQQRSDIEMEFSSVSERSWNKNQQQHRKTRKKELLNSKKIPLNIRQKKVYKVFQRSPVFRRSHIKCQKESFANASDLRWICHLACRSWLAVSSLLISLAGAR